MKSYVIAVYDRVTKMYDAPMFTRSIDRIQDEFDLICKKEDTKYHKNPSEFEVHELGVFNDSPHHDPEIVNLWLPSPRVLATGKNLSSPDLSLRKGGIL